MLTKILSIFPGGLARKLISSLLALITLPLVTTLIVFGDYLTVVGLGPLLFNIFTSILIAAYILKVIGEHRFKETIRHEKTADYEKMALLGQMSLNIVHEVRNPLTTIRGFGSILNTKLQDQELQGYCQHIINEADAINKVISGFYRYAKPQPPELQETNINDILVNLKPVIAEKCKAQSLQVVFRLCASYQPILVDSNQIKEVVLNIVQNAQEALADKPGGKIEIITSYCPITQEVLVKIVDNGCGMTPEERLQAGTPFYSLKDNHTGLGLSICYQYIKQHNGKIRLESTLGVGTKVFLYLPTLGTTPD